ncbi:LOW QUALITY PROTEIN: myelin regulatory factor-like protein [Aplochiton taeniatus]
MEPSAGGASRLASHVLGENEALQQFFDGQDMSGVLESSVVDTSILEQYLSNDMDPMTFMLPESPPYSGSEPCSPPEIPVQTVVPSPSQPTDGHPGFYGPAARAPGLALDTAPAPGPSCPLAPNPGQCGGPILPDTKKRRRTGSCEKSSEQTPFADSAKTKAPYMGPDSVGSVEQSSYDSDGANCSTAMGPCQLLSWEPYLPGEWSPLYDSNYQPLPPPGYHVDTDKGFNYSTADEAFVCQKKNHFQVTVHIGMAGEPRVVRTPSGPAHIDCFQVKVFGVKLEAPSHQVSIEQSQPDRSKKTFHPVRVSLPGDKITKVTLGRLHFSETIHNMRKKGKPNPDQRYFMMAVGLYATVREESYLLTGLVSERIIVRASNPGQFETDSEVLWQRSAGGGGQDAIVCHGRVGINTDQPDEALVVCGNAKVMGAVMHPSDLRAKHNIQEVDSTEQLKRIAQMRIVEYDYRPEFASSMGIDHIHETGIIAQEVKELLPAAVTEVGDVTCSDGEKIHNFLMVDKEQIFMENVGAVKQLCKLTDNLETRIEELEVWNSRLAKLKKLGSLRQPNKHASIPSPQTPQKPGHLISGKEKLKTTFNHCLHHKLFQASIITLVSTMAFCVIAITALYMLTLRDDEGMPFPGAGNDSNVYPLATTTVWPHTDSLHSHPDIDFCDLLYCEEVYCCPKMAGDITDTHTSNSTLTHSIGEGILDKDKEEVYDQLKNARDWTNTTIQSFMIKENQHVIDSRYCEKDNCGKGNYSYVIPISQFVPVNMRVTLLMNSTELLVVHLCDFDESSDCSTVLDIDQVAGSRYPTNTQGEHEWPLHVARLYQSSYHFRSTVAGQANCRTDRNLVGVLFTDYYFYFYRRCTSNTD